jgi:hypothetical protein
LLASDPNAPPPEGAIADGAPDLFPGTVVVFKIDLLPQPAT